MKKRIVSVLLCTALTLPLALSPARADVYDVPEKEKAAVLRELEIMVGDETGALHLERGVTRSEFTKLLMACSPYKDAVGDAAGTDPYPDVSHTSWYAPYVRTAVDCGLVKGDEQGWFHPDDPIALREGATMAVRLLGYQDSDFNSPWPAGQMALFRSLDLDAGVTAQDGLEALTRQDCLHIFYNVLCAKNKAGQDHINLLGSILDRDGEVDVPALFKVEQEGPAPLTVGWESLLPFRVSDALIFRDGERAELTDLQEYDLLYWAKDAAILFAFSQGTMGQLSQSLEGPIVVEDSLWADQLPFSLDQVQSVTRDGQYANRWGIQTWDVVYWSKYTKSLHAYSTKVHGFIEAISPSPAAPTAVTVAGRTYPLETFRAQYELSDFSAISVGDEVTLLLGRTGGVAAVMTASGSGVSDVSDATRSPVGVVTALTTQGYTDSASDPYAAKAVSVTTTAGDTRTYPFAWNEKTLKVGDLVRVDTVGSRFQVSKLSTRSLTGTVNSDRAIGRQTIAQNAEIIETWGDVGVRRVPLARLYGVDLTADMVRYYETGADGAITALILSDVTGDGHSYGVLTGAEVVDVPATAFSSMVTQGAYTLDLAGRQQVIPVSGKRFPVKEGPACLVMDGAEVETIRSLNKLSDAVLSGDSVQSGGKTYPLSDGVVYYTYNKDRDYALATRAQVLAGDYVLSAWYDSLPSAGGRVRVIVAQE